MVNPFVTPDDGLDRGDADERLADPEESWTTKRSKARCAHVPSPDSSANLC